MAKLPSKDRSSQDKPSFFSHDVRRVIETLGKKKLLQTLQKMLLIRHFEVRAEAAYLQGKIGGFFHSYMGQEAIQTACIDAFGPDNWWITSYRCHALALLLGATPEELMAELFGRKTGNALGRGGSMHFYTDRMLGGFGIVTGQVPTATGAAFALKYQEIKDQAAICFLGDGAVAQGAFHESLNMASLWDLPCVYVIENNRWGMGTAIEKAVAAKRLAEEIAPSYRIKSYTLNGADYFNCFAAFEEIKKAVLETSRPILVEAIVDRFRGHSISDPGLYRSKDLLKQVMEKGDPLVIMRDALMQAGFLDEKGYKAFEEDMRKKAIHAIQYAEESPWPDLATLEEDVFAP